MKRFIGNKQVPTLHIYIDLNKKSQPVAADSDFEEMKHPSVKRKYQKSDEWLKEINDLARSIYATMKGKKFNIIRAWPSKKSYTYYIRFQPADKNGDLWDCELQLQIELRDHLSETHADVGEVTDDLVVRSFFIEDTQYRSMFDVYNEVRKLLVQLQDGDLDAFLRR